MSSPDERDDLRPFGLLAALSGMTLALGLFVAFARTSFPEIGPAPNTLGIISRTTDIGYPTRRDVAVLASGISATLAGAALASVLWRCLAGGAARLAGASRAAGLRASAIALTPHLFLGISLAAAPQGAARRLLWMLLASAIAALALTRLFDDAGLRGFCRDQPHAPLFVASLGALLGIAASNAVATARGGGWRLHLLALAPVLVLAAWQGLATAAAARSRTATRLFLAPAAHALAPLLGVALLPFLHGRPLVAALVASAGVLWCLRRVARVMRLVPDPGGPLRVMAPYVWNLLVPVVLCLVAFDPHYRDHPVGREMLFYAEEGQHLAWANRILHGDVPGRDFFMLYGPLMEYGHALWLRVLGVTAPESRAYFEAMKLLGVLALYAFGRALFAAPSTALLGSLVAISVAASPRVAFGLLPLWAVFRVAEERKPGLVVAGALAALAGLYSQEVGIAATLACLVCLALDPDSRGGRPGRALVRFAAGALVVVLPFASWLWMRGALRGTVENLVTYPAYVTMGYANSPYPPLQLPAHVAPSLVAKALLTMATPLVWYVPPVIYLLGIVMAALPEMREARRSPNARLIALSLFGLVLFRAALGRSGPGKIVYVIPPALLVLVALGERSARAALAAARASCPLRAGAAGALALLVATYLVVPATLAGLDALAARQRRLVPPVERGMVDPSHPRLAGGGAPEATLAPLIAAVARAEQLEPGAPILAIPNDAVIYFLADRPNPTRFDLFSQIVTDAHRREVAAALERNPPALVILDTEIRRVDDISDERQFPEALHFLWDHYRLERRVGRFLLLQPDRGGPEVPRSLPPSPRELRSAPRRLDGMPLDLGEVETRPYPRLAVTVRATARKAVLVARARLRSTTAEARVELAGDGKERRVVLDMADRSSWAFDGPAREVVLSVEGEGIARVELLDAAFVERAAPAPRPGGSL